MVVSPKGLDAKRIQGYYCLWAVNQDRKNFLFIISFFFLRLLFFYLFKFIFKWRKTVLISVIQQHKSAIITHIMGFPGSTSGKEPSCQSRTHNETQVQFLGQEDPLEQDMATHSRILPGEFHRQRSLEGYSP